jgi:hypothetical protein
MSRSGLLDLMPGGRGERSVVLAADRYWDAVVLGEPRPPEVIDATVAETIDHLQTLDDVPLPDAAFAARLEGELLRQPAPIRVAHFNLAAGSRTAGQDRAVTPGGWPGLTRRMAMNVAATAALVTIIVTSMFVALWAGPLELRDRDHLPLVLAPGVTDQKLLLQARFDAMPDGVLSATISRWVLQPGVEVAMGREETSGNAPAAYLVETGALRVRPDVSIPVTRGDATTPTAVPEAAWTTLLPGDRMFVPADGTSLWRNDGDHPVRILEATFARREVQPQPAGVLNYGVIDEWPYATPDLPVIMSVIKITLHPEGALPADAVPGMAMLKPEAGRLVAIDIDGAGNPLPPIGVTQATRFLGSFPPGRVFRSGNNEPVTLLLVTIQDANPLGAGT